MQVYTRGYFIFSICFIHRLRFFYDSWWCWSKTIQKWQMILLSLSISLHLSMTSFTANVSISNDKNKQTNKKHFQIINTKVLEKVRANTSYYRRYSEWYILLTFLYVCVYFKCVMRMNCSYLDHIKGTGTWSSLHLEKMHSLLPSHKFRNKNPSLVSLVIILVLPVSLGLWLLKKAFDVQRVDWYL